MSGWYVISTVRRLSRVGEPFDLGSEERKGPYRWRWIAWWVSGGTWGVVRKILGDWYYIGSRIEPTPIAPVVGEEGR